MEPTTQSQESEAHRWSMHHGDYRDVPFLADVVSTDRAVVIRFVGELDAATLARAEGIAFDALDRTTGRSVVIDMSEVSFCGSSGLSLLVRLTVAARDAGREAVVRRPRALVRRIIAATRLDELLRIED